MKKTSAIKVILLCAILLAIICIASWKYIVVPQIEPKEADAVNITKATIPPPAIKMYDYVEVTKGCGVHFAGKCLNVYEKPDVNSKVMFELRNGIVLKVVGSAKDKAGLVWYKIGFGEILHPERVKGDWYVSSDSVRFFSNIGNILLAKNDPKVTDQKIVIKLSEQKLYAYDGDKLFMQTAISSGLDLAPTARGIFTIFSKMPSRYMQGPQTGTKDYFDLPGVPWVMYFTSRGDAIHGTYWHDDFGTEKSHGCINVSPDQAEKLYLWAKIGIKISVEK